MTVLTRRYQDSLARLRDHTRRIVEGAWDSLESYDLADVPTFVDTVVPVVGVAQGHAAALTDAYVASVIRRAPVGVDLERVTGAAVRAGTAPADVYFRPFVNVWMALKDGKAFTDAVASGRARAGSAAATDILLTTRATANALGEADDLIVGFQRVPDEGACEFCETVSGQRYTTADLMPIHNNCGCTVEPILKTDRHAFSGKTANDLALPREGPSGLTVAVREHGELGPVLVNAADHFTDENDI